MATFKKGDHVKLIGGYDKGSYGVMENDDSDIVLVFAPGAPVRRAKPENYLELTTDLDAVTEGDVLVDRGGSKRKVLGRAGQGALMSLVNDFDRASDSVWAIADLKEHGYKFATTEEPVKMTVAEIAERLGHEVEVVKEK
jgi:hypothetical protein